MLSLLRSRARGGVALLGSLFALNGGCTSAPVPPADMVPERTAAPTRTVQALALAQQLPAGGERCSVAQPMLLPPAERPLAALVSQSERLPWSLDFDVLAYARAERSVAPGARAVVELLQFVEQPPERVMSALARVLDRPIAWQPARGREPPEALADCAGELTCTTLQGQFLTADTVLLTQGDWGASEGPPSPCLELLSQFPGALEVSARAPLLAGTELRESTTYLVPSQRGSDRGLLRVTSKRFAAAQAAERALREALRGGEELPTLAGVPARSLGERHADTLEQTTFASFVDLSLARDDQQRSASALRGRAAPSLSEVDAHDAEAVRAVFDTELARARAGRADPDTIARLAALLERACALSPDDDGLTRRDYQLQLLLRDDARSALAIATRALERGLGDASGWRLAKRAALARFDEPGLRAALRVEHALSATVATRMARELSERVHTGQDYERAEWAFLTARRLANEAQKTSPVRTLLGVPLLELARLFAYLGQSRAPHEDLGVHVLAYGATSAVAPSGSGSDGSLWVAETSGGRRTGVVLAATSWDDTQLRTLGSALAARLDEGPVELVLGLETLGASAHTGRHVTLVLSGRRRGAELLIDQASRRLTTLPWPTLLRLLMAPLASMRGATFPPDELTLVALDEHEASELARAAETEPAIKCARDGLSLHCGGPATDDTAARRALLAVLHARLADAARMLWSGTD